MLRGGTHTYEGYTRISFAKSEGLVSGSVWIEGTFGCVEIPAGVTFDKKKLNLNSSGILKAFITLPDGYNATVAQINVSTVECEGAEAFEGGGVIPGKQALEVKFKIQNLTVSTGEAVLLTVTGELYDGTLFEGNNTLKVVCSGKTPK